MARSTEGQEPAKVPVRDLVEFRDLKGFTYKGRPATPTGKVSIQLELEDGTKAWTRSLEKGTARKTAVAAKPDTPAKRTTRKAPAKKAPARKTTTKK